MSNRIPNIYMFLIKLNKTKRFLHSKCISSTKMYFIVSKYVNCRRLTVYRIKKIHLNIDLQFGKSVIIFGISSFLYLHYWTFANCIINISNLYMTWMFIKILLILFILLIHIFKNNSLILSTYVLTKLKSRNNQR